ncbi:hypothetical protein OG275_02940 [Streptomyces niveus]|uniref:hypothetical protein n=1 Tax=Streptomyces niveus TaxID=193462 RepID=UPI002E36BFA9|nr:hypothetical protein [Streptomyces niveus]
MIQEALTRLTSMGKPSWKPSGVAPASSRAPWSFMFTKRSLSPKYREMLSPIIVMSGRQAGTTGERGEQPLRQVTAHLRGDELVGGEALAGGLEHILGEAVVRVPEGAMTGVRGHRARASAGSERGGAESGRACQEPSSSQRH